MRSKAEDYRQKEQKCKCSVMGIRLLGLRKSEEIVAEVLQENGPKGGSEG